MLHSGKNTQDTSAESKPKNRRKNTDRRISQSTTKFPFVDDGSKLVMSNRRKADRRIDDTKVIKNPLKVVRKLFKR